MKLDNPEATPGDVNKLLSESWKAASAEEKAPYEAEAKVIYEAAAVPAAFKSSN